MKPKSELIYQANELRKQFGGIFFPDRSFAIMQSQEHLTLVFTHSPIRSPAGRAHAQGEQLVAINSTRTLGRQRFTAAHELYHLFIQDEITTVICGNDIALAGMKRKRTPIASLHTSSRQTTRCAASSRRN